MFGDRVRRGRKQEESRSIWVDMLTGVGYRLDIGVWEKEWNEDSSGVLTYTVGEMVMVFSKTEKD